MCGDTDPWPQTVCLAVRPAVSFVSSYDDFVLFLHQWSFKRVCWFTHTNTHTHCCCLTSPFHTHQPPSQPRLSVVTPGPRFPTTRFSSVSQAAPPFVFPNRRQFQPDEEPPGSRDSRVSLDASGADDVRIWAGLSCRLMLINLY